MIEIEKKYLVDDEKIKKIKKLAVHSEISEMKLRGYGCW